jgi:hypothetical protein
MQVVTAIVATSVGIAGWLRIGGGTAGRMKNGNHVRVETAASAAEGEIRMYTSFKVCMCIP